MAPMKNTRAQGECIKLFEKIDARLGKDVADAIVQAKKQAPLNGVKDPADIVVPGTVQQQSTTQKDGATGPEAKDKVPADASQAGTPEPERDTARQSSTTDGSTDSKPAKTSNTGEKGANTNAKTQQTTSKKDTPAQ